MVSISGAPTEPTTDTSVDLTCTTGNGDDPITFQWIDIANPGVTLSTNAMYTASVVASGEVTYRCTAVNEFGMDSDNVTLVDARELMTSYIEINMIQLIVLHCSEPLLLIPLSFALLYMILLFMSLLQFLLSLLPLAPPLSVYWWDRH